MKRGWKFVAIVLVGAAAFVWLVKVPILSFYLTEKLRVPVGLVWVSIWPTETTLRDFKIQNPEGFDSPYAFKVKEARIDYHLKSLFSEPVTFDQIALDTVFVEVIFSPPGDFSNNWTVIGNHMPKPSGRHAVYIDALILENITIVVRDFSYPGEITTRHFDRLEFHNINSARGFPTEEMIRKIFGGFNLGDLIKDAFDPKDLIEDVLDPVRIF